MMMMCTLLEQNSNAIFPVGIPGIVLRPTPHRSGAVQSGLSVVYFPQHFKTFPEALISLTGKEGAMLRATGQSLSGMNQSYCVGLSA